MENNDVMAIIFNAKANKKLLDLKVRKSIVDRIDRKKIMKECYCGGRPSNNLIPNSLLSSKKYDDENIKNSSIKSNAKIHLRISSEQNHKCISEFKKWVINNGLNCNPEQKENSISTKNEHIQNHIFLVDFELLSQKMNGLDLIEDLGINPKSFLVTSRYEEDGVKMRCQKSGVKLIPKILVGILPIELMEISSN